MRPAIGDGAEIFFDLWKELVLDGVAVGALIGRVHRVAVVEIWRNVLWLDDDHAWQASGCPILKQFIRRLLATIFLLLIGSAIFELGIRRRGAELGSRVEVAMVVVLIDDHGEARVGVLGPTVG